MISRTENIKDALHQELLRILTYWTQNTVDQEYGGFVGRINFQNEVVPQASKGIILNTRILWSFSAAAQYLATDAYDEICHRAYHYLKDHFFDRQYGGVCWEVDFEGTVVNSRKQVYAQAFAIYALSEYYAHSQVAEAKNEALALFSLLEENARDRKAGGYLEALDREWQPLEDMRLSAKDLNAAKTMNTHLHILEAYTRLWQVRGDIHVKEALQQLIDLYNHRFLAEEGYYHLFFDEQWGLKSHNTSYGHDIESAWLVLEAARAVGDPSQISSCEATAAKIAARVLGEAIDEEGALLYEKDLCSGVVDKDRHWWPQVECMVGFAYHYQETNDLRYLTAIENLWKYTEGNLLDIRSGEWYFRVDQQGKPYEEDVVSMWKAPYHTTRACMVINRIL